MNWMDFLIVLRSKMRIRIPIVNKCPQKCLAITKRSFSRMFTELCLLKKYRLDFYDYNALNVYI